MTESENTLDFEQALKRLQQIIEKLEDEDLNLSESVRFYEEGIKLSNQCEAYLEEVRLRIEKVNQKE